MVGMWIWVPSFLSGVLVLLLSFVCRIVWKHIWDLKEERDAILKWMQTVDERLAKGDREFQSTKIATEFIIDCLFLLDNLPQEKARELLKKRLLKNPSDLRSFLEELQNA